MRSYRQRLSRRAKAQALRSALSVRARAGALTVLEPFELPDPKTKAVKQLLLALGVEGRALLVLPEPSQIIWRCGRNIPGLTIRPAAEVSGYDVMAAQKVIVLRDAVARLEARLS
jgi:large subunit ribosomal protein L4